MIINEAGIIPLLFYTRIDANHTNMIHYIYKIKKE